MPSSKDPNQVVQPGLGGSGSSSAATSGSLPLYGGGPDWADGTTNPATSVNGQLTKILVDLASLSGGSAKIGSAPLVGANDTIVAGTLFSQLGLLKLAGHIEYAGGPIWLDGSANPSTTVELQLDKIITDLSDKDGSARVGSSQISGTFSIIPQDSILGQLVLLKQSAYIDGTNIVGASNTIAAADLHTQLVALKQSSNIEYAGGPNWLDGTTNAATLVETQLDKIIIGLTDQGAGSSGAHKLGSASIPGTSGTIAAGTIYSALAALKNASNIEHAGSGTWADGTTNPATSVELQLDKIISDLVLTTVGQSGARKLGCEARSAWLGGRTNPLTDIFNAVEKIIVDLGATANNDDGMERIGGQTVAGSPYTLTLGSARSQATELLGFVNTNATNITNKVSKTGDIISGNLTFISPAKVVYNESVTRISSAPWYVPGLSTSQWALITGLYARQDNATGTATVEHDLDAVTGDEITEVSAIIKGGPGHGANPPGTKPTLSLFEWESTSATPNQIAGPFTDPSLTGPTYESLHKVTLASLSITVAANKRYFVRLTGESGGNAQLGLEAIHLEYVATSNGLPPGL